MQLIGFQHPTTSRHPPLLHSCLRFRSHWEFAELTEVSQPALREGHVHGLRPRAHVSRGHSLLESDPAERGHCARRALALWNRLHLMVGVWAQGPGGNPSGKAPQLPQLLRETPSSLTQQLHSHRHLRVCICGPVMTCLLGYAAGSAVLERRPRHPCSAQAAAHFCPS